MILMYSHLRTILIHYRGSVPAFYPSQLAIRGELNTTHPRPSAERHVWVLDAESFRVNLLQYKVKVSAISARGQRAEMVVRVPLCWAGPVWEKGFAIECWKFWEGCWEAASL